MDRQQMDGHPKNIMPPLPAAGEGINTAEIIFKNTIFIYISMMP